MRIERDAGPQHGPESLRAAADAHREPPLAPRLARAGVGPYRGYGEILRGMEALVARGARVLRIGTSVLREPLLALALGAEGAGLRPRTTVVLAGVHPNEWIGVETCLALLDRLVGADLGDRALIAVPVVNPDGFLKVERGLRAGRHRFVRGNARGVDLNRNFDVRWDERGLVQRLMSLFVSPGSRPASEPEVEGIAHLLSGRRIDRALSLHSFGGAVLYPPAFSIWPAPDAPEHRAWASRIGAAADPRRPYRAIQASWFSLGVKVTGLELDWFHERHGAVSLLVECSRGGFSLRPSKLLSPFAWFNPPDLEATTGPLADALMPYVVGEPL